MSEPSGETMEQDGDAWVTAASWCGVALIVAFATAGRVDSISGPAAGVSSVLLLITLALYKIETGGDN